MSGDISDKVVSNSNLGFGLSLLCAYEADESDSQQSIVNEDTPNKTLLENGLDVSGNVSSVNENVSNCGNETSVDKSSENIGTGNADLCQKYGSDEEPKKSNVINFSESPLDVEARCVECTDANNTSETLSACGADKPDSQQSIVNGGIPNDLDINVKYFTVNENARNCENETNVDTFSENIAKSDLCQVYNSAEESNNVTNFSGSPPEVEGCCVESAEASNTSQTTAEKDCSEVAGEKTDLAQVQNKQEANKYVFEKHSKEPSESTSSLYSCLESNTTVECEPPIFIDDASLNCENVVPSELISEVGQDDTSKNISPKRPVCDVSFIDRTCRKNPYVQEFISDSENSSESSKSSEESSDDSSSTVSLSDEEDTAVKFQKPKRVQPICNHRTKGELLLEELPPIEDLQISIPEAEAHKIGQVWAIVALQVVIESLPNERPLDLDSVLFLSNGKAFGKVFDVFGKVTSPYYSVRFNTLEDITSLNLTIGDSVYSAPDHPEFSIFVFTDDLKKMKGTDASWKDNNEPPVECIDFSDDEEERRHKQKLRGKNRKGESSENGEPSSPVRKPRPQDGMNLPAKHFLRPQRFQVHADNNNRPPPRMVSPVPWNQPRPRPPLMQAQQPINRFPYRGPPPNFGIPHHNFNPMNQQHFNVPNNHHFNSPPHLNPNFNSNNFLPPNFNSSNNYQFNCPPPLNGPCPPLPPLPPNTGIMNVDLQPNFGLQGNHEASDSRNFNSPVNSFQAPPFMPNVQCHTSGPTFSPEKFPNPGTPGPPFNAANCAPQISSPLNENFGVNPLCSSPYGLQPRVFQQPRPPIQRPEGPNQNGFFPDSRPPFQPNPNSQPVFGGSPNFHSLCDQPWSQFNNSQPFEPPSVSPSSSSRPPSGSPSSSRPPLLKMPKFT